ncbi:MAG TPA: glutathione S-transferase family protein [Casimicrobiaceae bacterium]|jgi:glutathione S-transferase|nr:glutathione S-transferase family protein [Casimicrobiaceae bacterium]
MVRLLGRATSSNVQKVLWCLRELGVPFAREDYGGMHGRTRDEAYLRLNPNGKVPTLIDRDTVLWESNTILRYLCNRYGPTALYPIEPALRAGVERWMDWQLGTLAEAFLPLYRALVREGRTGSDVTALRERSAALFALLNDALGDSPFLAGAQLSLAEIALGPLVYRWLALPIERPDLARLVAWYGRFEIRPAFRDEVAIGLY